MLPFRAAPDVEIFRHTFEPGQEVPESGIYRVDHDAHRLMHQATLEKGSLFPRCRQCSTGVRFRLVRRVESRVSHSFGSILEKFQ